MQGGQVRFEDAPNHAAEDSGVSMDQTISEGDDAAGVADQARKVWLYANRPLGCRRDT